MSDATKERMSFATMWIFRSLAAFGAFFLVKIYNRTEDNNETLLELKQSAATNDVFYRMTLLEHDRTFKRWEDWVVKQSPREID